MTEQKVELWAKIALKNRKDDEEELKQREARRGPPNVSLRKDFSLLDLQLHFTKVYGCLKNSVPDLLVHELVCHVPCDKIVFGSGAQRIMYCPNAGGTSRWSESLSFEILEVLFGAELLKTEMELSYRAPSKRTDYSCKIYGTVIGVSVTRAMRYGGEADDRIFEEDSEAEKQFLARLTQKSREKYKEKWLQRSRKFEHGDAEQLLSKKLFGITNSTQQLVTRPGWTQQMLHVFCENKRIARVMQEVLDSMDPDLRNNTIVLLTVSSRDPWIFYNPFLPWVPS